MRYRFAGMALCAALLLSTAPSAYASTATANLTVTASVAQKCIISAATLAFGSYDPVVTNKTANLDQSATMTLTCTKGATGITMDLGSSGNAGTGCTAPQRCLSNSGAYLNYQLYSDSARTAVWTTGVAESVTGGVTTPTNVTVYGRIPGGQDASVGASYQDTVVATVNF